MTSVERLVAMVFGASVALAGLVLVFYRKEEGKNHIKLFGQEIEISTPALVVFLAGCGIFILPFFIPAQTNLTSNVPNGNNPMSSVEAIISGTSQAEPSVGIIMMEVEPNDNILEPNLISVESTIQGRIMGYKDKDYYKFRVEGNYHDAKLVFLNQSTELSPDVQIFDKEKNRLVREYRGTDGADLNVAFPIEPNTFYYIGIQEFVTTSGLLVGAANYKFSVTLQQ